MLQPEWFLPIRDKACSGMFSDNLDKMGHRGQVIDGLVMNVPGGRFFGRARTIRIQTLATDDENIRTGLGFLESVAPGEILCVEASRAFAYFGELMSRLSLRRGLGGVVIGGLTRDSFFTRTLRDLTVAAEGYSPRDIKGRGRVEATDVEVRIRGVVVAPGDWVFADGDGVVVTPQGLMDALAGRILANIADEEEIVASIDRGAAILEILDRHKEF
jgi:regulator of RNase E activity RraA